VKMKYPGGTISKRNNVGGWMHRETARAMRVLVKRIQLFWGRAHIFT
jgi:hypothetical protein